MVTGGNGFIGSHFVDFLLKHTEYEVINIDLLTYAGASKHPESPRYTFYQMNIGDKEMADVLEKHRPVYIVNFAAETHVDRSINDPFPFVKTNILSTYNFICNVQNYWERHKEVRLVHMSTDEVYGELLLGEPAFTERSQYNPNSPYSATKASGDHLIRAFHKTYGLPAIIVNCSNNYGPRQFPEKFIPVTILSALNDKEIPVYGTGMNIRDWIYVEDTCGALYEVMECGKIGDRYNIGGGNELTNLFVATSILQLLGKPISLLKFVEDRKGHDFRYAINDKHMREFFSWEPLIPFEEGLIRTINWYNDNTEWVKQCGHSV